MASVQTTDAMRDRTMNRAVRFRDHRLERADKEFCQHLPNLGCEIYDLLVGEEFSRLIAQLPDGMFRVRDKLRIHMIDDARIAIYLPMGGSRPTPSGGKPIFPSGWLDDHVQSVDVNLNTDHENWAHLKEPVEKLVEARRKAVNDHQKLITFTRSLLKTWSSVGPALRAWPALWDMMDVDDQQRQGARPKGTLNSVPASLGGAEIASWATAKVTQMKLLGIR